MEKLRFVFRYELICPNTKFSNLVSVCNIFYTYMFFLFENVFDNLTNAHNCTIIAFITFMTNITLTSLKVDSNIIIFNENHIRYFYKDLLSNKCWCAKVISCLLLWLITSTDLWCSFHIILPDLLLQGCLFITHLVSILKKIFFVYNVRMSYYN